MCEGRGGGVSRVVNPGWVGRGGREWGVVCGWWSVCRDLWGVVARLYGMLQGVRTDM